MLACGEDLIQESLPCEILAPVKNRGEEAGDGVPGHVGGQSNSGKSNIPILISRNF